MTDIRLIGKPVYDTSNQRVLTIKGVLPDGRLIAEDTWGQRMVVALGDVWKLDRTTQEELNTPT